MRAFEFVQGEMKARNATLSLKETKTQNTAVRLSSCEHRIVKLTYTRVTNVLFVQSKLFNVAIGEATAKVL